MAIEPSTLYFLLNFGVLGVWNYRLIKKEDTREQSTNKLIENNTKALTLVNENIRFCQRKNNI